MPPPHQLPQHLMLGLHLSLCRLAKILWRYRDDDWISAKHFLESLLGICNPNHFNCKDRMLFRAASTSHVYVVLYAWTRRVPAYEPVKLVWWVLLLLSFRCENCGSERWSHLPKGAQPVGRRARTHALFGAPLWNVSHSVSLPHVLIAENNPISPCPPGSRLCLKCFLKITPFLPPSSSEGLTQSSPTYRWGNWHPEVVWLA